MGHGHEVDEHNLEHCEALADAHHLEHCQTRDILSQLLQDVDKVEFDIKEREDGFHVKSDEWSCEGTVTAYSVTQNDNETDFGVTRKPKKTPILRLHYKAEKGLFFDNGNMDCYIETISNEGDASDTSIKLVEFSREHGASKFNPLGDWKTDILIGELVYAHVINNEFRRIDASGGLWRYQKTCQSKTQFWGLSFLCFLPTLGIGSAWCCMKASRTDTRIGLSDLQGTTKFRPIIVKPNGNTVCDFRLRECKGDPKPRDPRNAGQGWQDGGVAEEKMPMAYKIDLFILTAFGVGERVTRRPPNV